MTRNRIRRLPIHSYRRMWMIADRLMRSKITDRKEVGADMEGIYGMVTKSIRTSPYWARYFRDDAAIDECVAMSFIIRT